MTRVALYCRVSTPDQHIENQLLQLRALSAKRGYQIIGEYTDRGISGVKVRRPGLDAMMKDARHRKFDMVFVSAFDRIFRSTRHLLQVLDELESFGIEFASAREAIDTTGPMGRLFLTLIGSISALERDILRDRVRQGISRRRLMGLPVGRQPLDVDHDAIVADRLVAGMSLTAVAQKYSVSRASVVRWVRMSRQSSPLATPMQPVHEYSEEVAA